MNEVEPVQQQSKAKSLNQKIRQLRQAGCNVIGNETYFENVDDAPVGYRYAIEIVNINPDPKFKECYPQQGGDFSLSGHGLRRIAKAMNVRTLPGQIVMENETSIVYRARAYCRGLDGQPNVEEKDYKFDLGVRADEFRNKYEKKVGEFQAPQYPVAKIPVSFKICKGDHKGWIEEQVRIEMIQCRKNAWTKAQTGAQLRCIRALGPIQSTYTAGQLRQPFLIVKLVQWLDGNNPIDRQFALEQSKVPMMMFPAQEIGAQVVRNEVQTPQEGAITAQMPLQLPSAEESQQITEALDTEEFGEEGQSFEEPLQATGRESAMLDFESMSADERKVEIASQIQRRQWKGKLRKDLGDFTLQEMLRFYEMLLSLPVPDEPSADPWE